MRVAADDDVGAGVDERLRELLLARPTGTGALDAPVQVDDDGVDSGARRADAGDQPVERGSLVDASPGWVSVAVHASISQSSSTSVAAKNASRWPFTVA